MSPLELDAAYGMVRKAVSTSGGAHGRMAWEVGRQPLSLCELDSSTGSDLAQLRSATSTRILDAFARSVTLIWAMSDSGQISVAVEEVAQISGEAVPAGYSTRRGLDKKKTLDDKLGHPCLTADDTARIAGEIYLDFDAEESSELIWTVSANSGRFHYEPTRRPTRDQLRNAAKLIANAIGQKISIDFLEQSP